ncbi:WD repeat-containing protein 76 [Pseudophryne corroboree]|uniref:WD repeat-containing protein 76 n=1 Tax=Pseudophryne corroboree TaxID=495146 RepID=UPI0030818E0B
MSSRRSAARARGKKVPRIPLEITPSRSTIPDRLSPPPLLARNGILTSSMGGSPKKRPLEPKGTPVRTGYMRRQPSVNLFNMAKKLENEAEKQSRKESDDGHSDRESLDDGATPISLSHVLPPSNKRFRKMDNRKTYQHKDSAENKACVSLETNSAWKQPMVKLLRLNLEPEEEEKQSTDESDVSDCDQPPSQEQSGLSAYELKRLNNIKENSKFLNSLKLLETASSLHPPKKQICKRKVQKKKADSVTRRSLRLQCVKQQDRPATLQTASSLHPPKKQICKRKVQNKKADSFTRRSLRLQCVIQQDRPASLQPMETVKPKPPERIATNNENSGAVQKSLLKWASMNPVNLKKPPGPIEMIAANNDDCEAVQTFLRTWASTSQDPVESPRKHCKNLWRYTAGLRTMKLTKKSVARVVPSRVTSVAVHPSRSEILVAAGDKWGYVGLWDMKHKSQTSGKGVYLFVPHCKTVSTLLFSPSNPEHLLSLSYDGTVRCTDLNAFMFDEAYRDEEGGFSSFDFLSSDGSVLIVSHWDSRLSVVDRRTPGTTHEMQISLSMPSVRTVSVHPLRRDLCAVAGYSGVYIYDIRKNYKKKQKPAWTVPGHTQPVLSAYFSPGTGHRILTTCFDGFLRVYNSESLDSSVKLHKRIRHKMYDDVRPACFRAIWDPKEESCFMVGSLATPRQIVVFHENGKRIHTLWNAEKLTSVCSINAIHPTRNLVVGGNASGRLHMFYK